jgi:hypothetical protein
MTTYEKEFLSVFESKYGDADLRKTFELLVSMGLIEPTMCKVAVIRHFVNTQVADGVGKLDAMWNATEHFACTYEYVRRCMYYYRDMNIV